MSNLFIFATISELLFFGAAIFMLLWALKGKSKTARPRLYRIKVKSAHGVVTRLTLNQEQYIAFSEVLSRPDGIFDIDDDKAKVFLERRYIAAVEVRVR